MRGPVTDFSARTDGDSLYLYIIVTTDGSNSPQVAMRELIMDTFTRAVSDIYVVG